MKKLFIILTMLLLILSCSHKRDKKPEGFVLQEFNIIENQLYELLKSMHDSAYILKNNIVASPEEEVLVLIFRQFTDSVYEINIGSITYREISEYKISIQNFRIVGYVDNKDFFVLLFSDIRNLFELQPILHKLIAPTNKRRKFDYIYLLDNLYLDKSSSKESPNLLSEKKTWIPIPSLYDPYYYKYKIINGKIEFYNPNFSFVKDTFNITTNPKLPWNI